MSEDQQIVEYQTTKAECEAGIDGVCPGCGGPVVAIETVDNAGQPTFWSGCEQCHVFTEGYPVETHQLARTLVQEGTLVPWSNLRRDDSDDDARAYWLQAQTREAARIVRRVLKLAASPLSEEKGE